MTAGDFSEVDLDLLADYVGGVLDGTPEQARVARLVAEDPDWALMHAALTPAVDGVRGDLADWGAEPLPMPEDVTARLTAALATAPPVGAGPSPPRVVPGQSRGGSSVVPGDGRPASVGPVPGTGPDRRGGRDRGPARGRARRRWSRLAAPLAVAAAVVAFAGFGAGRLVGPSDSPPGANENATVGAAGAPAPQVSGAPAPGRLLRSGTDYSPQTVAEVAAGRVAGPQSSPGIAPGKTDTRSQQVPPPNVDRVPPGTGLTRLDDQTALATCLNAVGVEHGTALASVNVVDYASFAGRPALVVAFTDAAGQQWVWVSGPECGVPGSGADTRYRSRVG